MLHSFNEEVALQECQQRQMSLRVHEINIPDTGRQHEASAERNSYLLRGLSEA